MVVGAQGDASSRGSAYVFDRAGAPVAGAMAGRHAVTVP
jgi:hypothetical protein